MAISKSDIQSRLKPWLRINLPTEVLQNLRDADFLDLFNDVARDLNELAQIHIERFYKTTNATNATPTDSEIRNYKTQRRILRVYDFRFEDANYQTAIWTYIKEDADGDGRIVLKTQPGEGTQLDAWYLGDIEPIADDSDEIDLPESVLMEFFELVKKKVLVDYGKSENLDYEQAVQYYSEKAYSKKESKLMISDGGVKPYWFGGVGDRAFKYNVMKNYVSPADNVYTDGSGDYHFYT